MIGPLLKLAAGAIFYAALRGVEGKPRLLERRLMGLRWDSTGEFTVCAPRFSDAEQI